MKKYLPKIVFHVLLVLLVGVLSACNDDKDDNSPGSSTLSGTAAVGAAMTGTVTAVGANGNTESISLAADGTFSINSSSLNFPVLVKADNGAGTVLYSWALSRNQKANITPLTTLALILSDLPDNLDTLFGNWAGSASAMNASEMIEAQAIVNANLQAQLASAGIDYTNYDFLKTPFSANSTGIDAALDALDFTFTFSGSNFASVVDIKLAGTSTPVVFDQNIDISAIAVGGSSAFIPSITTFAPASGAAGTTVTINGNGFDEDKFHMTVSFSNNVAAQIVSSSKTELVVTVPAGAVSGPLTVTHGISGQSFTSSARFTVTSGGGGGSSDWTARNYGSSFMLKSIAYSGSTFAAVGLNNTIVTSTDGISWTSRSAPDNHSYTIYSVIWDGAQFVAVGDVVFGAPEGTDPLIATSPDGITWTRRNWDGTGASLLDVTVGKGHLTAIGPTTIISSTDNGATWTEDTLPALSTGSIGSFTGVASSAGIRVAVGKDSSNKGLILVSASCCSWTEVSTAMSDFHPYQVIANGNQFVAMGAANANFGAKPVIQTSSDGSTWTTQTLPASIADSGYSLLDGAWTGNRYIVVGNNGALASERIILSSTDGENWEVDKKWATSGQQNVLSGVASSGTMAIAVGDSLFSKDISTP